MSNIISGGGTWWLLRHTLFWVGVYGDELLYTFTSEHGFQDLMYFFVPMLLDMAMVYINLYTLIPRYILGKKYGVYAVLALSSVVANVAFIYLLLPGSEEYSADMVDYMSTFISCAMVLGTAIALKISKFSYQQLKTTQQLKAEQSQLELNYLKQQINPHFLFNVLNTINIQSKRAPETVSDTVIQLSDLLRYQIYDAGKQQTVALEKDIEFLKNYVELEKLRRQNLNLSWQAMQSTPKVKVTPFLFLPLIENAFKHSRKISEEEVHIDIKWQSLPGHITLIVKNTVGDVMNNAEEGGFGIDNLKKRLELLYPDSHQLSMSIKNDEHIATLTIGHQ